MDDFALNGAAINGQPNEWITLEGSAVFAFDAVLEGIRGAGMVANWPITLDGTAAMSAGIIGIGTVGMQLDGELQPSLLTKITGSMPISIDGQMLAALRVALAGALGISPEFNLDIVRWALGQGSIDVEFGLTGEGRTVAQIQIEGVCGIVLEPLTLDGRRTPAHRPDMPMSISLEMGGPAWLKMQAAGNAQFASLIEGIGRIGGKVGLQGAIEIEMAARGDMRRYALVPIEGVSDVQFALVSELAGRPEIPAQYVPAPTSRRFNVARESRERMLVNERSL